MDVVLLAEVVKDMRRAQAAYFRGRTSDLLAESVRLEALVDRAVREVLGGAQLNLFPSPEPRPGGRRT